jgi:uncharacterized metal-binding protein YceD (DUF177 family)
MARQDPEGPATQAVLASLDPDAASIFRGYLDEPVVSTDLLAEQTRLYFKQLEAMAEDGEVVDLELITDLVIRCERLLDEVDDDMDEEHRRLVQAAVRYFVNDEDADADLESLIGFDDDGAVIEAVAVAIGRSYVLEPDD